METIVISDVLASLAPMGAAFIAYAWYRGYRAFLTESRYRRHWRRY